jgi:hypothetical protein
MQTRLQLGLISTFVLAAMFTAAPAPALPGQADGAETAAGGRGHRSQTKICLGILQK